MKPRHIGSTTCTLGASIFVDANEMGKKGGELDERRMTVRSPMGMDLGVRSPRGVIQLVVFLVGMAGTLILAGCPDPRFADAGTDADADASDRDASQPADATVLEVLDAGDPDAEPSDAEPADSGRSDSGERADASGVRRVRSGGLAPALGVGGNTVRAVRAWIPPPSSPREAESSQWKIRGRIGARP